MSASVTETVLSAEHTQVCQIISKFFKKNSKLINDGIGLVCDGEEFPEIHDHNGRVWMEEDARFCISIYARYDTNPGIEKFDITRIRNRFNRMFREPTDMGCTVENVEIIYHSDWKMIIVDADIICYDG